MTALQKFRSVAKSTQSADKVANHQRIRRSPPGVEARVAYFSRPKRPARATEN